MLFNANYLRDFDATGNRRPILQTTDF